MKFLVLLASLWGLSATAEAKNIVVSETGMYFIDFDCDYRNQEIGPVTNRSLYVDWPNYLAVRFDLKVRCYSRSNGHTYTRYSSDALPFLMPIYEARTRTWYVGDLPVAWYQFDTHQLELNPDLEFAIWSHHMNDHLSYAIEINEKPAQ